MTGCLWCESDADGVCCCRLFCGHADCRAAECGCDDCWDGGSRVVVLTDRQPTVSVDVPARYL